MLTSSVNGRRNNTSAAPPGLEDSVVVSSGNLGKFSTTIGRKAANEALFLEKQAERARRWQDHLRRGGFSLADIEKLSLEDLEHVPCSDAEISLLRESLRGNRKDNSGEEGDKGNTSEEIMDLQDEDEKEDKDADDCCGEDGDGDEGDSEFDRPTKGKRNRIWKKIRKMTLCNERKKKLVCELNGEVYIPPVPKEKRTVTILEADGRRTMVAAPPLISCEGSHGGEHGYLLDGPVGGYYRCDEEAAADDAAQQQQQQGEGSTVASLTASEGEERVVQAEVSDLVRKMLPPSIPPPTPPRGVAAQILGDAKRREEEVYKSGALDLPPGLGFLATEKPGKADASGSFGAASTRCPTGVESGLGSIGSFGEEEFTPPNASAKNGGSYLLSALRANIGEKLEDAAGALMSKMTMRGGARKEEY